MIVEDALLPTGLSGLDTILGGGLSRPSLAVIIGTPGAGKTVLASNIIFNAARQGLKTIVFTSFSECPEQCIPQLCSLGFFEASLLGDSVQLFTVASVLAAEATTPATAIARTIRATTAKIVFLDGFQSADPLLPADESLRLLLSALA